MEHEYIFKVGEPVEGLRSFERMEEVVRCKDCKHRPIKDDGNIVYAPNDSNGWDDETCPCLCEDCYYNWMPEDDFFCKRGERREDVRKPDSDDF